MNTSAKHNEQVRLLFTQLVKECPEEAQAMVVLESLITGVMLYFRPDPRHAAEFLDMMTTQVIERVGKLGGELRG